MGDAARVAFSEFPHTTAAPTATAWTGAMLPLAGTLPATVLPPRTLLILGDERFWCWMTWRVDNVWVKRDRYELAAPMRGSRLRKVPTWGAYWQMAIDDFSGLQVDGPSAPRHHHTGCSRANLQGYRGVHFLRQEQILGPICYMLL